MLTAWIGVNENTDKTLGDIATSYIENNQEKGEITSAAVNKISFEEGVNAPVTNILWIAIR